MSGVLKVFLDVWWFLEKYLSNLIYLYSSNNKFLGIRPDLYKRRVSRYRHVLTKETLGN